MNPTDSTILVTGGTGTLGRAVADAFRRRAIPCTVASRTNPHDAPNWVHLDVTTGDGLDQALTGTRTVLHLADSQNRASVVEGTRYLLDACRRAGVGHVVYMSIVGIDEVPVAYYGLKREAERLVEESGLPFTVLRATQFHEFADQILRKLLRFRLALLPKRLKIQPVAAKTVAEELVRLSGQVPLNRTVQLGGPEVLTLADMASAWLSAHGKTAWLINVPLPQALSKALKSGKLTCPDQPQAGPTWSAWLAGVSNSTGFNS